MKNKKVSNVKNKLIKLAAYPLSALFLLLSGLYLWGRLSGVRITAAEDRVFAIHSGETLRSVSFRLEENDLVTSSWLFRFFVKIFHSYEGFQAGRYLFSPNLSPSQIVKMMNSGKTHHELLFKISLPEGLTLNQVIDKIALEGYAKEALRRKSVDQKFLKEFGIEGESLEGYLFPSTYSFYDEYPNPEDIFRAMVKEFFYSLPEDYENHLINKRISLQDAVVVASLIEKETSLEREKSLVSEVVWNRLKRKMFLGIDASLIYGIPNFSGNLTKRDLKNKRNLYNTRVHKGLPPSPICNPSQSSLRAVLNPSKKGYLFYVLKPGSDEKEHSFSKTLSEHNKKVQDLIQKNN